MGVACIAKSSYSFRRFSNSLFQDSFRASSTIKMGTCKAWWWSISLLAARWELIALHMNATFNNNCTKCSSIASNMLWVKDSFPWKWSVTSYTLLVSCQRQLDNPAGRTDGYFWDSKSMENRPIWLLNRRYWQTISTGMHRRRARPSSKQNFIFLVIEEKTFSPL